MRIERTRRSRTGYGLASRPIASLATFQTGGRGGTRTHTPFRAFGFQDRCRYADSANSSVFWWTVLASNQASRSNLAIVNF